MPLPIRVEIREANRRAMKLPNATAVAWLTLVFIFLGLSRAPAEDISKIPETNPRQALVSKPNIRYPLQAAFDRIAGQTLRKWRRRWGPLILELPLRFTLTPTNYSVDVGQ